MAISKAFILNCLKKKQIPNIEEIQDKKTRRILKLLFKIEKNPTRKEDKIIDRVFNESQEIIPELMTVYRKIHKNRNAIIKNPEKILKLRNYKYIRTYATFVNPKIKVMLLQQNDKLRYRLASAFIYESDDFIPLLPINMLDDFIQCVDSFHLVFDYLLEKCSNGNEYLDLLGGYIKKYPTLSNLEKLNKIKFIHPDFVRNVWDQYFKCNCE